MRLRHQVLLTSVSKSTKHLSVFILAIFLTRYFSKAEYGTYLQVMLLANTGAYFALFGIPSSIYYFLPRVGNKRKLMRLTTGILVSIALIVSFIIYQLMPVISEGMNNSQLADYAWLIAAFILLQIPIKLFEPFMITTENVSKFVAVNASFNIGFLFVVLIPVLLGLHLSQVFFSLFLFYLAQFLVIYIVMVQVYLHLSNDSKGEPLKIGNQIKYSMPIGFAGAVNELGTAIDKLIVSGYFNPAQLAVYARGAMEIPMLSVIANSLGNILMPRFVLAYQQGDYQKVLQLWHSSVRMMALIVYPAFIFFVLTANHLIPFLFSDAYLDSVIIFQIYCFSLLTRVTSYDVIARAVGQTQVMLKLSILALIMNVVLSIALIKWLGIIGAPIATVIVMVCIRYLHLRIITGFLEVSLKRVFPWSSLLRLLICAVLASIVFWPVLLIDLGHFETLALSGVLYLITFLFLFRYSDAMNKEEKSVIRSLIPKALRWVI